MNARSSLVLPRQVAADAGRRAATGTTPEPSATRALQEASCSRNDLPLISVVTPSYNQGRFLERCIQSVLAQDYPVFEHIIYDNCSTDETLEVLRRYPHLVWTSEPDAGQSDALNKAIAKARGEIIAWINADDFYLPGVFDLAARELHASTGGMVIAGKVQLIDLHGTICETFTSHFEGVDYLVDFWSHPYGLCQPGVLFRREVVQKVGWFRTDLQYAMDYEFWLRVATHFRVRTVDTVIAGYLLQEDSKTVQAQGGMRFWDDMEAVSRRYWGPRFSLRRQRLARACNRHAAEQLAAVLLHAYQSDGELDWSLLRRLLHRAPLRLCNRHVLAAVIEQLIGPDRWDRIKALCRWRAPRARGSAR